MLNLLKVMFSFSNKIEKEPIAQPQTKEAQEQATALSPSISLKSISLKQQGNTFLSSGDMESAAQCYRQAIDINPGFAEAHLNLGFVLNEQKLYEEASQSLKLAIRFNPKLEDAHYLLAMISQELGNLEDAITLFNKAIEIKPDFEIAYHGLGRALIQNDKTEQAKTIFIKANTIFPNAVDFLFHLGKLYAHEGNIDKAIDCFQNVLAIQPDFAEAHFNVGLALQIQDKQDAATTSFQNVLSIEPDHVGAHANLGVILQKQGKLDAAIASYRSALNLNFRLAEVHNLLASALHSQGKLDEAIQHLQQAVAINPNYADAYKNLGAMFEIQKNFEASVENYLAALSINPGYAEAHSSLANAFRALGKYDAALASGQLALELNPDLAETHFNLANIYNDMRQHEAAIAHFQTAISIKPDYAFAHYNLAAIFLERCNWHQAIPCFEKTIALIPDFAMAHLNLSCCQLLLGQYEVGWAEYEWRWQTDHMRLRKHSFVQPLWLGKEPLLGKTILLDHEQGFGDTIQFCRFAKLIAAQGAKVLLVVPPALRLLLTGIEGVDQLLSNGDPLPAFDYHCPLMSLPLALSTQTNNIPSTDHYIQADTTHMHKWQGKLKGKSGPRVGLVWSGSTEHQHDNKRTIPLASLLPFLPEHVQLVSLQKELRPIDKETLLSRNDIPHFGDELQTFMDTAGLIANLDLVISVDTSVAHLAGAMGKPVWILLPFSPDWRWMLERKDSPWYLSARLFRQPAPGDWNSVLSNLRDALKNELKIDRDDAKIKK